MRARPGSAAARRQASGLGAPQHVLVALGAVALCPHGCAVAKADAVDHQDRQVQFADGTREPLRQLLLTALHDATQHPARGGRAQFVRRRPRILRAGILPGRHARGGSCHRRNSEGVVAGRPWKLGSVSSPWLVVRARRRRIAMRWPPTTTWLAVVPPRSGAATQRAPLGVRYTSGTAQHSPLGFQHRAVSTYWPASMRRPSKARCALHNTHSMGSAI